MLYELRMKSKKTNKWQLLAVDQKTAEEAEQAMHSLASLCSVIGFTTELNEFNKLAEPPSYEWKLKVLNDGEEIAEYKLQRPTKRK